MTGVAEADGGKARRFETRLYKTVGGELELHWGSASLPAGLGPDAEVGVSEDGRTWFAISSARPRTVSVGSTAGGGPEWRWTDRQGGLAFPGEGVAPQLLDENRVVVGWEDGIAIVERGKAQPRALPLPARCDGGIGLNLRLNKDALWSRCSYKGALERLTQLGQRGETRGWTSEDFGRWLLENADAEDGHDFFVAYPLARPEYPIVFSAQEILPGSTAALWVTPTEVAVVDVVTGRLRGVELDLEAGAVRPTNIRAVLDPRFVSSENTAAPFAHVESTRGPLVALDGEGGVSGIVSLSELRSATD